MAWNFADYKNLPEVTQRALFEAGLTLHGIQATEFILAFCLSWVFPKEANLTLLDLYAMEPEQQKKTLGQLLHALRQRADIAPDLDAKLTEFLAARNRFAHHLLSDEPTCPDTEAGSAAAIEFMVSLRQLALDVQNSLMGHFIHWTQNAGVEGLPEFAQKQIDASQHLSQLSSTFQRAIHPKH